MNRDDVTKLARQHGKPVQEKNGEVEYLFTLEGINALLAAEREECAKVCDRWTTANHVYVNGAIRCAADIRARGNA